MNIIHFLLCVLANQVTGQIKDIFPARILAKEKTISENSDLFVTCSTFGSKKDALIYVYLCKDNLMINKNKQKQDQTDTSFGIHRAGLHDSGNYSCVYSVSDHSLPKIAKRGLNIIQILVIDISAVGPHAVREGDHVEFRCTVSNTLQTLGGCQLIHSYLMRDKSILQVKTFNVMRMEATFTIEGAVMRDSGHYSCVVLPSKCIEKNETTLFGNNSVLLSVKVKGSVFVQVIVFFGVIILILSLGLCLWYVNKQGYLAFCNPREASHHTAVVEEQREQREGEDLDAKYGDSVSVEEYDEWQSNGAAEDFSDYDDLYSTVDDQPANPSS